MKQQRISSEPRMPTTPRVKKVRATPNERNDSWSIKLVLISFESQKHRTKHSGIPSLFGETKDLASDIANYSANENRQANLV
jgi:hypothetical protein